MPLIGEYAKRFGVYDELPNYLSYALGAGETTVMRMVTAYSMFANGGRRVKPTLIDRIQDRYGHTIFKHDQRECRGCDAPGGWKNQPEPQLIDRREQVLDPMTAYQITSMMEGVVQARHRHRGQGGRQADRRQDRHHQRRERTPGSSASRRTSWSASISATTSRAHLGKGNAATGGHLAAPIARDFLKLALADKPAVPFKVPAGIKLVRVDRQDRHARRPGRDRRNHPRSLQAGHRAAG